MFKEKIKSSLTLNVDDLLEVSSIPSDFEDGSVFIIRQSSPNTFTHNIFKYPCKFIPEIPRWAINKYASEGDLIFDPFSGSGTTLLEANLMGFNSIGTEIDSLAKKLIEVKTTSLNEEQLHLIKKFVTDIDAEYDDVLEIELANYYPDINNLYHWFTEENTKKLAFIKREIEKVKDEKVKSFLEICLASILRKTSNADDVSPKPYISTRIIKIPLDPFEEIKKYITKYYNNMIELHNYQKNNSMGHSQIIEGNALDFYYPDKFKVAITSPPYINAFDYARTLRLENLWLDLESEDSIRVKKKEYVGTENITKAEEQQNLEILSESKELIEVYYKIYEIDSKRANIVKRFFEDMKTNLRIVFEHLPENGTYTIVIGNSTIRKIEVESWKILIDIAINLGFTLDGYFGYLIQNPYLRIPRGNKGGKIDIDIVFTLRK